jgi:hypothetical protein
MQNHTSQLALPLLPMTIRAAVSSAIPPVVGALRLGDHIACTSRFGPFRPCDRCSGTSFVVEPGAGPHAAGLRCDQCGGRGRWLSRIYMNPSSSRR